MRTCASNRDYLNLSTAVDVSDFLMAVAGSFDDAIRANEDVADPADEDFLGGVGMFFGGLKTQGAQCRRLHIQGFVEERSDLQGALVRKHGWASRQLW